MKQIPDNTIIFLLTIELKESESFDQSQLLTGCLSPSLLKCLWLALDTDSADHF